MKERNTRPYISFNYNEWNMNIGKDVVRVLGVPEYISLFINEEKKTIAVMAAEKEGSLVFPVPEDLLTTNWKMFRIYSKGFLLEIMNMLGVDRPESIKVAGEYDSSIDAVVFDLSDNIRNGGNNVERIRF